MSEALRKIKPLLEQDKDDKENLWGKRKYTVELTSSDGWTQKIETEEDTRKLMGILEIYQDSRNFDINEATKKVVEKYNLKPFTHVTPGIKYIGKLNENPVEIYLNGNKIQVSLWGYPIINIVETAKQITDNFSEKSLRNPL